MPFAYLRDPVFLACFVAYWCNRLIIKQVPHPTFFDAHFNDLICVPFFAPLVVWLARTLRLRGHDRPPLMHEIMSMLLVWSVLFEMVYPQHPYWRRWVVGDPYDIVYYTIGACASCLLWQDMYLSPKATTA